MGTYTTNYNLFMPTVGETGWGELVNGNFATIDTTMKGLDGRITTLEAGEFSTINCTGTITASEFVGGVGNFGSLVMPTLTYEGYYTVPFCYYADGSGRQGMSPTPIFSSPFPISGKVSVSTTNAKVKLMVVSTSGAQQYSLNGTQTEYNVTNAVLIYAYGSYANSTSGEERGTLTIGIPNVKNV